MEDETLIARIEWAADLLRDIDVLLHAATGDQRRIELGKDFVERQRHRNAIAVDVVRKNIGRKLPQFSEADSDRATRKLGKNFLERDRNAQIAHMTFDDPGLQFEREAVENLLERNLNGAAILALSLSRESAGRLSGSLALVRRRSTGGGSALRTRRACATGLRPACRLRLSLRVILIGGSCFVILGRW